MLESNKKINENHLSEFRNLSKKIFIWIENICIMHWYTYLFYIPLCYYKYYEISNQYALPIIVLFYKPICSIICHLRLGFYTIQKDFIHWPIFIPFFGHKRWKKNPFILMIDFRFTILASIFHDFCAIYLRPTHRKDNNLSSLKGN